MLTTQSTNWPSVVSSVVRLPPSGHCLVALMRGYHWHPSCPNDTAENSSGCHWENKSLNIHLFLNTSTMGRQQGKNSIYYHELLFIIIIIIITIIIILFCMLQGKEIVYFNYHDYYFLTLFSDYRINNNEFIILKILSLFVHYDSSSFI